jgi:hypothetical protein
VLTGYGRPLTGTLLVYDAEDMTFSRFALQRRADCPICGNA